MNIPLLEASDIECRVQSVTEGKSGVGAILLLYKNARVDMNVLDKIFGVFGWQRKHEVVNGNLFCTISIWDEVKGQWVQKEDVGTESNTDPEKGQASDAFKRACVNIGIGRELYTSPFIYVPLEDKEYYKADKNGKTIYKCQSWLRFCVDSIEYNESRKISKLTIVDGNGKQRYSWSEGKKAQTLTPTPKAPKANEEYITQEEAAEIIKLIREVGKEGQDRFIKALDKRRIIKKEYIPKIELEAIRKEIVG